MFVMTWNAILFMDLSFFAVIFSFIFFKTKTIINHRPSEMFIIYRGRKTLARICSENVWFVYKRCPKNFNNDYPFDFYTIILFQEPSMEDACT